ncbi:protein CutA homolog [Patella vulgata]|uniref:protein CutA homolog n=1 Tax=Patella vulgata TaxID=6465 RepID=UPI0024A80FC4|nr:protein CutA homolog [Patella vulgata]
MTGVHAPLERNLPGYCSSRNCVLLVLVVIPVSSVYFMPLLLNLFRRGYSKMAENYVSGTHSMAFITVPDMEVAKQLSHGIVKEKLAACVNIIPGITSVYEWENEINEDKELLLMVKTHTSKVDSLSEYVRHNHPYDVAEVISSKIDNGNPPYLKWISDIVMSSDAKKMKTEES